MIPNYVTNSTHNRYETYDTLLRYKEGQVENSNRIVHNLKDIYKNNKFVETSKIYKNWTYAAHINMYETDWGVIDLDWDGIDRLQIKNRGIQMKNATKSIMKTLESVSCISQVDMISSSVLYGDSWVGIPKLHIYFKLDKVYDISPIYKNPIIIGNMCGGFTRWAHSRGGVTVRISKKFGEKKLYLMDTVSNTIYLNRYDNNDTKVSTVSTSTDDDSNTFNEKQICMKTPGQSYMDNESQCWSACVSGTSSYEPYTVNLCTEPILLRTFNRTNGALKLTINNAPAFLNHKLFNKKPIIFDEGICLR